MAISSRGVKRQVPEDSRVQLCPTRDCGPEIQRAPMPQRCLSRLSQASRGSQLFGNVRRSLVRPENVHGSPIREGRPNQGAAHR